MLGWMNNWQYGNDIPTSPWRSPMSLAREVSPITSNGQLRLSQRAVCEADTAPEHGVTYTGLNLEAGLHAMAGGTAAQLIEATFIPGSAEEFGLVIRGNGHDGTRIGIRPFEGRLTVDRMASGNTDFHEAFASIDSAPLQATGGSYDLRIFVDHCSVEIFAQDGQVTMTELIFPDPESVSVATYASEGTATVSSLKLTTLAAQ